MQLCSPAINVRAAMDPFMIRNCMDQNQEFIIQICHRRGLSHEGRNLRDFHPLGYVFVAGG
jgi:hypothetical protein